MKVSSNLRDCPRGSVVKNPPAHARDMGSVPGSGRPPGEGNGNPLQYSCLGNPMDGGAWWATVHGLTKSWTWLSNWAAISNLNSLEMNYLHVSRQKRTHRFFPESRKVTIEFPQLWPQLTKEAGSAFSLCVTDPNCLPLVQYTSGGGSR